VLQVAQRIARSVQRIGHVAHGVVGVFMNGSTLAQSGQRKVFNAFGEVTEEQIVWGASGGTTFEYNPFGELFHQTIQLDSTRAQETWRYYDTMGRETRTIVKSNDNIAGVSVC
jgi:hypothetical protein